MNGFLSRSAPDHVTGWRRVLLGIVILAALQARPACASPIRIRASEARIENEWASFLAGGSRLWASVHAPPITLGIRLAMFQSLSGSSSQANPFVQYLVWRHNLDPARFNFWHPRMGPIIERLPAPTVAPQTLTNPGSTTPPVLPPPQPTIIPPPVPEPGSLAIAAVLIGAGVCWKRRPVRPAAAACK